jgi:hypothetical protein
MKLKYLLLLFFVIGLIGYGFYISKKENDLLKSCSFKSEAIVVDKYRLRKKGYTIKYQYKVKGERYSTSETIKDSLKDFFSIGDTILIKYSCKDYNVSSIN